MSNAIQTGILADKDHKLTSPAQCTNYLHDNSGLSLYDRITDSLGIARGTRDDNAIALIKLAASMEYTSMGSIVIRSGDEMGYSSSQSSAINWNNLITYSDLHAYYSNLIQLRKTISKLTSGSTSSYSDFVFDTTSTDQIAYVINNDGNNQWNKIAVMHNNSDSKISDIRSFPLYSFFTSPLCCQAIFKIYASEVYVYAISCGDNVGVIKNSFTASVWIR